MTLDGMVKTLGGVLLASLTLCACGPSVARNGGSSVDLKEAGTNFDADLVAPFLDRVAKLIESGFGAEERNSVVQMVASMKVDEERTREFNISYRGQKALLRMHVFLDDVDAPDIAFFTVPELADAISEEISEFFDERGM